MSEIICPHCGAANPPEAIDCKKCHRLLFEFESSSSGAFSFLGENDDWLQSLREDTEPLPEAGRDEAKPIEEAPLEDEVPDWLARIRQRSQEELGREQKPPFEGLAKDDLPDWLKGVDIAPLEAQPSSQEAATGEELPLPDWLSLVSGEQEPQPPSSPSIPPFQFSEEEAGSSAESLPEWLRGLEEPEMPAKEIPSTLPEELPDWLISPSLSTLEGNEEKYPLPSPSAEEEPDWLKSFEAFASEPSPFMGQEESAEDSERDWLKAFETYEGAPEPSQPESPTTPSEFQFFTSQEDWLEKLGQPPIDTSPQETDIPPALQGSIPPEIAEIPSLSEPAPTTIAPEDWFGSLAFTGEETSAVEGAGKAVPASEQPEEDLASLGIEDFSSLVQGSSNAFTLETIADQPPSPEETEVPPFISDELPEWFDEQVFETPEETHASTGESETSLEPAELPGWLEAMRPIEAVAPGRIGADEDHRIETSGPLAGFQGILPAEGIIAQYTKPPIYSARLHINERQRTYANLLETLLQEEKQGLSSTQTKSVSPHIFGRMLLGILLSAVVLFVLVTGIYVAPPPTLFAPENVAFFSQIQSLTASSEADIPILVALDFEPALAGEISSVARPVMEDLLRSGRSIAIISVNPAGSVLAEELLKDSARGGQVVNLGYLPGGVTSIAALASQPRVAAPNDRFGTYMWDQPPFQSIQTISDFAAILLLTDNTDSSRLWIEQIAPQLDQTPLLIIASSQAAPIIQLYLQNRQVSGMLAGLPGLAAYQRLSGRSADVSTGYLGAYQIGLVLILILILVFNLYHLLVLALRKPEAKRK